MRDDMWNRLVPAPGDDETARALGRVRAMALERAATAGRRWRAFGLAAALAVAFAAGWWSGYGAASGRGWLGPLAGRGIDLDEVRAVFVAVPERQP